MRPVGRQGLLLVALVMARPPLAGEDKPGVFDVLRRMAAEGELGRPPLVMFAMGGFQLKGVMQKVSVRYTSFGGEGGVQPTSGMAEVVMLSARSAEVAVP